MMPSMEQFVAPLDLLNAAADASEKPDFLVMLGSPALLDASVVAWLLGTMLNLLEHRLSLHVKLCRLQELGLPQERSILIVVASPFCAPLPWCLHWPPLRPPSTLRDLIADLAFDNPRTGAGPQRAFVCSPSLDTLHEGGRADASPRNVYNHQTGRQPSSSWKVPLQWDTDAIVALSSGPQSWTHPGK